MDYEAIIQRLLAGNPNVYDDESSEIFKFAIRVTDRGIIQPNEVATVCQIIKICNIIYNNASNIFPPLPDDKYDQLIVICKNQGISYPVGSPPVNFTVDFARDRESEIKAKSMPVPEEKLEVMTFLNMGMPYYQQLIYNQPRIPEDYKRDLTLTGEYKKQRNTNYQSSLCGTLDKCKYVLNMDAQAMGAFNDQTVAIFERDFLSKHIAMGIVNPNFISLIVTLKYDGISVECIVKGDTVVAAYTRGDTDNGEVADLSPVFEGMKFPRAKGIHPDYVCAIKAEAIVTDADLNKVINIFNKSYVNPRNAVIGLLGGLDARKYRDFVTLVPLEGEISPLIPGPDKSRYLEIQTLNKYFSRGIDLRSIVIQGTYDQVLLELKSIVSTADSLRGYMGFQYDGVVVEYADPAIRQALGKRRSIPNYSIAIKFPALKQQSTFTHYTFSVGQTGVITPMAHFLPVYFMGQKHDKCTVHSLRKVNQFQLRAGDKVDLTYNNDVMVYLVPSPPEQQPQNNPNPIEYFPEVCPCCGTGLVVSESGDSAYCPNFNCSERMIARVANCLAKLNIKGFSTETIRALDAHYLADLFDIPKDVIKATLGDVSGQKFIDMLHQFVNTEFYDYRIFGAIGFTGCANEVWKKIFRRSRIDEILRDDASLLSNLQSIDGIGPKTVDTILTERQYLMRDLEFIVKNLKIKSSFNNYNTLGQVRFSGIRDLQLVDLFNNKGFDASNDGSVTKNTTILVVPMSGFVSTKVEKAFKFINNRLSLLTDKRVLSYNDLHLIREFNVYPCIFTVQEAYQFIQNFKG